jgi:DNA-binding Lrp family transcriptional regulator
MPKAIVLINADLGTEAYLVEKLRSLPQVKEAYFVFGVYDLVAVLEAKAMEELKEAITTKIRSLTEVRSTLTMMVIE